MTTGRRPFDSPMTRRSGAIARRGAINGYEAVTLENGLVRAVIIPSLGGRVWNLTDLRRDGEWIWHRPTVPLSTQPVGAPFSRSRSDS